MYKKIKSNKEMYENETSSSSLLSIDMMKDNVLDEWIDKAIDIVKNDECDGYDPNNNHLISAKEMWDGIDGFDNDDKDSIKKNNNNNSVSLVLSGCNGSNCDKKNYDDSNTIEKKYIGDIKDNKRKQYHDKDAINEYKKNNFCYVDDKDLDEEIYKFRNVMKIENDNEFKLKQKGIDTSEFTAEEMWVSY